MSVEAPEKPKNDTGIYIFRHTHDWELGGAYRFTHWDGLGFSAWHPTYICKICTNVIVETTVDLAPGYRFDGSDPDPDKR